MVRWNSRLGIVEERIGELETSVEEITQIEAERDKELENIKKSEESGR